MAVVMKPLYLLLAYFDWPVRDGVVENKLRSGEKNLSRPLGNS